MTGKQTMRTAITTAAGSPMGSQPATKHHGGSFIVRHETTRWDAWRSLASPRLVSVPPPRVAHSTAVLSSSAFLAMLGTRFSGSRSFGRPRLIRKFRGKERKEKGDEGGRRRGEGGGNARGGGPELRCYIIQNVPRETRCSLAAKHPNANF